MPASSRRARITVEKAALVGGEGRPTEGHVIHNTPPFTSGGSSYRIKLTGPEKSLFVLNNSSGVSNINSLSPCLCFASTFFYMCPNLTLPTRKMPAQALGPTIETEA